MTMNGAYEDGLSLLLSSYNRDEGCRSLDDECVIHENNVMKLSIVLMQTSIFETDQYPNWPGDMLNCVLSSCAQ